jgi:hypothetical protein
MTLSRLGLMAAMFAGAACAGVAWAGAWTEPVPVFSGDQLCAVYRAQVQGQHLVIEVAHEPGWHTVAMDNQRRVEEKLAGKKALGVDSPTEITVSGGLEVVGPWYQSPPKDASKPELNLFTWQFEGQTLFVAKVRRAGTGPAQIAIRGQACTETTCRKFETAIELPVSGAKLDNAPLAVDLKTLVQVR